MTDVPDDMDKDVVAPTVMVSCWRCELDSPVGLSVCPHCEASLGNIGDQSTPEAGTKPQAYALKILMWSFALLMATTIILAVIVNATTDPDSLVDDSVLQKLLNQILVVEGIDTIIIFVAILLCPRSISAIPAPQNKPWRAWLLFVPMLALMMLLNFGYHELLREILHLPLIEEVLTLEFSGLILLTHCIQPALVEELYCRGFVLKVLHSVSGKHGAVWISAILFGLLHIGMPFSIPYLVLLGAYLGYARIASNGLLLPIVLHFVHNLLVMMWN